MVEDGSIGRFAAVGLMLMGLMLMGLIFLMRFAELEDQKPTCITGNDSGLTCLFTPSS